MKVVVFALVGLGLLAGTGCNLFPADETDTPAGLPVLGSYGHSLDHVVHAVVATADEGLKTPRDVEFHPQKPNEMWVANRLDNSMTIFFDAENGERSHRRRAPPKGGP